MLRSARDEDLKRETNERFRQQWPDLRITLTKLRSLKNELFEVAYEEVLLPVLLYHFSAS